jgi:hypothetical protein
MPAKELDMKKWVHELRLSYHGTKYTCRRATYFIDKREAQRLSWSELSELYLHLYICPFCRRYKTQIAMVRKVLRLIIRREAGFPLMMDTEVKQRLQSLIEKRNKKI